MATFFNEFFGVTTDQLDEHGAFNISVINDMRDETSVEWCLYSAFLRQRPRRPLRGAPA